MRKVWIALLSAGLVCCASTALLPASVSAKDESISGRNYRAVEVAVAEFERWKLDLSRYRIFVMEAETSFQITFWDADAPELGPEVICRGNCGTIPGLLVEVNRNDLRVIRSYFIKVMIS